MVYYITPICIIDNGIDRHRWGYNVCKGGAAGLQERNFLINGYSALRTPMQLVGTLSYEDNKYIVSLRNGTSYCVQHHPVQINRLLQPLRNHYNTTIESDDDDEHHGTTSTTTTTTSK